MRARDVAMTVLGLLAAAGGALLAGACNRPLQVYSIAPAKASTDVAPPPSEAIRMGYVYPRLVGEVEASAAEPVPMAAPVSAPAKPLPAPTQSTADKAELLRDDLMAHPELIPAKGRVGGTMRFHDREAIRVLSERWVYARFDDGHVQGHMLLEYKVDDAGQVGWSVLESYLD